MNEAKVSFESGVFLVDKPAGVSSFWVVQRLRRILAMKKVGHAGTLDPFATGLLVVCAGRKATKMISSFMEGQKEYLATLCLGVETETLDPEGEITATREVGEISGTKMDDCLASFVGEQLQTPPAYSALKYKGKPLYHYARKGVKVTKEPRKIEIAEIEWLDKRARVSGLTADIQIRVACSKGTYIRSLADDIGKSLGCGAYLSGLRRTRSGFFTLEKAITAELLASGTQKEILSHALTVDDVSKLLQ